MRRELSLILVAVLLNVGVAALADPPQPSNSPTDNDVKAFALRWYAQMQVGQLDRSQLTAAYSAQLSDDAVRAMVRNVNSYGASPTSAEILHSRRIADQRFYLVKLIFPRGDAASLLVGFDAQGKITGIFRQDGRGLRCPVPPGPYGASAAATVRYEEYHPCLPSLRSGAANLWLSRRCR